MSGAKFCWLPHPLSCGSQRGMSMIELLVTMGLVSIMGVIAIPALNSGVLNLSVSQQNLVADIRMARANATTRGAHFKVSLFSESYTIERLQDGDDDGVWEPDGAFSAQTVELPSGVTLSFPDNSETEVEFTTRGLLEDLPDGTPASIVTIEINDSIHGETKTVEVWPSGQVQEV